jgi:hypothetical protein
MNINILADYLSFKDDPSCRNVTTIEAEHDQNQENATKEDDVNHAVDIYKDILRDKNLNDSSVLSSLKTEINGNSDITDTLKTEILNLIIKKEQKNSDEAVLLSHISSTNLSSDEPIYKNNLDNGYKSILDRIEAL